jgi:protein SCO1/2
MRNVLLAALIALAGCAPHAAAPLHGTQLVPSAPAANFTLVDQNGHAFSLAQARGQAVALYFGFTQCKDICPQTRARIVMVSVDPQHDTPAALRSFFRRIGVEATGLTGTRAQLRQVYRAYGVAVQRQKHDIVHSDVIFLIDANGRIVETLPPEIPLKDVAADLRTVLD